MEHQELRENQGDLEFLEERERVGCWEGLELPESQEPRVTEDKLGHQGCPELRETGEETEMMEHQD